MARRPVLRPSTWRARRLRQADGVPDVRPTAPITWPIWRRSDDPAFAGRYPSDYLAAEPRRLMAWHLVGGLDPLSPADLRRPARDTTRLLEDWIRTDGLKDLK